MENHVLVLFLISLTVIQELFAQRATFRPPKKFQDRIVFPGTLGSWNAPSVTPAKSRPAWNVPFGVNRNQPGLSFPRIVPDDKKNEKMADGCLPSSSPLTAESGCCGIDRVIKTRIASGNVTSIWEHPWLVQIESYESTQDALIRNCGGFLISNRYVITAAHCFRNRMNSQPVNVILGDYNIANEGRDCNHLGGGVYDCTDGAISIQIEDFTLHENYVTNAGPHDIAIVRLKTPVEYSDFIKPICLPTLEVAKSLSAKTRLVTAGWGRTEFYPYSDLKRHVDLPFMELQKCRISYPDITEYQLCAGGEMGKDSCERDSGGPLIVNNDGLHTVVGVVSKGLNQCGTPGIPGVYTNVYRYLRWIDWQIRRFRNKYGA